MPEPTVRTAPRETTMRKLTITAAITAAAALALTGCAKGIDDITPDMPVTERDEIYVQWVEDNYGDQFQDMRPAEAPDVAESVCDLHREGLGWGIGLIYSEFDDEDIPSVQDIVNTGVRVYCPEFAGSTA